MLIFLDSSIFCADFHLTSTSFELLKDYICKGGNWLCFSEIVIDEVKNKYKERITGLWQKANSDIQELNKSMVTNVPTIPEEHISREMKSYEDFWDMIPFQYGNGAPEDYPTTTHRDVVHRALERKKPFKDDGKDGYRDYLIWLTFLNVVHHYAMDEACFITLNTRDFSDPIDKKELHPQLKRDLEDKGISLTRVSYFTSLKEFVEARVKPSLQIIELHEKLIEQLKADRSGFMYPLEENLAQKITGLELSGFDIVLEEGENPSIGSIDEVSEIEIETISEISQTELLLSIRAQALCNINFCIHKSDFLAMEDRSQMSIIDNDWNKHYILAETPMELEISLEVIYDSTNKQIKSMDIESVEDAYADCLYCPY